MEIVIKADPRELGDLVADAMVDLIARKPNAVLGLATGSSPLPAYDAVVRRYQEGAVSFAGVRCFTLDEYVGLPADHPETYRNVIRREFTDRVDLAPDAVHGLDGNAPNLAAACAAYEQDMADVGGVDLQLLGIGTDGHIAFNEPGSSLASRTRIKTLTKQTRLDNSRFFDGDVSAVPVHCLTQGLGTILEARHLVLMAAGESKAEAIRQMVEGPVSARWPGTILQLHPHATVLLDEAAASRLENVDYYRESFEAKPDWQGI